MCKFHVWTDRLKSQTFGGFVPDSEFEHKVLLAISRKKRPNYFPPREDSMLPSGSTTEGVGVIIPPADVRAILETTASFVAKKPAFEAVVLKEHEDDPRFTFLQQTDPYHAYYRQRITEKRAQLAEDNAPSKPTQSVVNETKPSADPPHEKDKDDATTTTEPAASTNGTAVATGAAQQSSQDAHDGNDKQKKVGTTESAPNVSLIKVWQAQARAARPEPRDPPPEDVFTLPLMKPPPDALTLDVMKLSAEHVARQGPQFLKSLSQKEARNPLFDFLRPMHPYFLAFQRLTEAYKIILDHTDAKQRLITQLEKQAMSPDALLNEIWYIHDWECQKAEREHEAGLDEKEKVRLAQIDWHDFIVVSTVDFKDDDEFLPAPVEDARQLPKMLAAARIASEEKEKNRENIDMDIDVEVPSPPKRTDAPAVQIPKDARVHLLNIDSDIPENRIRRNVQDVPVHPASGSVAPQATGETTVTLPSGQRVPLSKAGPSMRAELRDPSYKHERERAAKKNKLLNLADGDEVARNLARWDQEHKEAGVYNRGDLQEALRERRKGPTAQVGTRPEKTTITGPTLPVPASNEKEDGVDVNEEPAAKRARVEAAVGVLSKGKKVEEVDASEIADIVDEAEVVEKVGGVSLLSAEEWLKKQGNSAKVRIKVAKHPNAEWNLQGQEIELSAPLKSTVMKLKNWITKNTKLPANKQKLQLNAVGFLKDSKTLAFYNVGDGAIISLEVKERGGRKKH